MGYLVFDIPCPLEHTEALPGNCTGRRHLRDIEHMDQQVRLGPARALILSTGALMANVSFRVSGQQVEKIAEALTPGLASREFRETVEHS